MSNPNEGYAFVTNKGWDENLSDEYPDSISVGTNYKLIQFSINDIEKLKLKSERLGYTVKNLDCKSTITQMESGQNGPFLVYYDSVHHVIDSFNSKEEEE